MSGVLGGLVVVVATIGCGEAPRARQVLVCTSPCCERIFLPLRSAVLLTKPKLVPIER